METISTRLLGEKKLYTGFDTIKRDNRIYHDINDICIKHVHGLTLSGMPFYHLIVKKGSSIMLIKNIDQPNGLCNETRLQFKV